MPTRSFDSFLRGGRSIFLISFVGFLYVFGNGSMWFVFPLKINALLDQLKLNDPFVQFAFFGLLYALPNIVSLFLDVSIGGLSDRVGRKKILITGLIVMALIGLLLPSADSIEKLAALLVVFGLMNQMIFITCRAYVMDISLKGKTSEYFGFFEAAGQFGFALGPLVAGILIADNLALGQVSTGLFFAALCLSAMVTGFMLKETVSSGESSFVGIRNLIKKDRLIIKELLDFRDLRNQGLIILLITFVFMFTDGWIWAFEPLYTTLGMDAEIVGLILVMFILPLILFQIPAGYLADNYGKKRIMIFGMVICSVFLALFGLVGVNPLALGASAFMAGFGMAFARPALDGMLTDLAEKKQKGGIVGVWDVFEDLGYVIGPITGGLVAGIFNDISVPFIFLGALLFCASLLVAFMKEPEASKESSN